MLVDIHNELRNCTQQPCFNKFDPAVINDYWIILCRQFWICDGALMHASDFSICCWVKNPGAMSFIDFHFLLAYIYIYIYIIYNNKIIKSLLIILSVSSFLFKSIK